MIENAIQALLYTVVFFSGWTIGRARLIRDINKAFAKAEAMARAAKRETGR